VDRGAVGERDHVVDKAIGGVDVPVRRVGLDDVRALRGGAVTGEPEHVAGGGATAGKVHDRVAVRLAGRQDENIVADAARHRVGTGPAVQRVVVTEAEQPVLAAATVERVAAGIAVEPVGEPVADAVDRRGPGEREILKVCAERE
jgi:hypothetical protein